MDSTTMLLLTVATLNASDASVDAINFTYSWWMGPSLFTIVSLLWARFWPFKVESVTDAIFGRLAIIIVCLIISLLSWIIGGILK